MKRCFAGAWVLVIAMLFMAKTSRAEGESLPKICITLHEVTLNEIITGSKDTKYDGTELEIHVGDSVQTFSDVRIKGHGNSTWSNTKDKKPYQIQFAEKTDVLGLGRGKKWLLLANWFDVSHMRNALAFRLAKELNIPGTPDSTWVELYVDGQYEGLYLICEKVEIGEDRLELTSSYGVLVELDNMYGETADDPFFRSAGQQTYFVCKDAVNDESTEAFKRFEEKLNEFEALLFAEKQEWEKIEALIDVDSFINMYFLQEFVENVDVCCSSFFMYTDGEDDVIHLGPCWDFDGSLGNFPKERGELGGDPRLNYILRITRYRPKAEDWFRRMFCMTEFKDLAVEAYRSRIKPVLNSAAAMLDAFDTNTLRISAEKDMQRWQITEQTLKNRRPYQGYHGEVRYLKEWVAARTAYMNAIYSDVKNIRP